MLRWTIVAFTALGIFSAPASAQYIGIFMDPEATTCAGEVGSTPFRNLYVVAVLEGSVPAMTGAQFQITGIPDGWTPETALWVPDTGVGINLGHPFFENPSHDDTPGVNVAFAACQGNAGEVTRVPLGRIVLLGAPTPQNVHLRLVSFDLVPIDPDCPFVTNCEAAAGYPKFCVGGGEIVLNGSGKGGCAVAVSDVTWSHIKELYRQ